MTESSDLKFCICPECSASVKDAKIVGGIWTGGRTSKASNGPMFEAWCAQCGRHLLAMPTREDAEAGLYLWERYSSDETA
jgi:hypothetical protein